MSKLSILSTEIREINGRFSLNDLHKASGSEPKSRPGIFLQNQQTIDLIEEIQTAGIPAVETKEGKGGGTYGSKEVVVAYGAWISPKVHLAVIRAFLNSVEAHPIYIPPATTKALPGKLSCESQDAIKAAVRDRLDHIPQARQGQAARTLWGALNVKFGTKGLKDGYKNIPNEALPECLSLIARVPLLDDTAPAVNPFDFSDALVREYMEAKLHRSRFLLSQSENGTMILLSVPYDSIVSSVENLPRMLASPALEIDNPQTVLPEIIKAAAQRLQG